MKKILILIFISCSILIISCKKETWSNPKEGMIVYTGEPEVDGCGFMLVIGIEYLKPLNLPVEFEKDSLKVKVQYVSADEVYYCFDSSAQQHSIMIQKIVKL